MYITELVYVDPIIYLAKLSAKKSVVFFDGMTPSHPLTRYSFIAYDPILILTVIKHRAQIDDVDQSEPPSSVLAALVAKYSIIKKNNPMPFTSGFAGYIGYDFYGQLEPRVTTTKLNEQSFPDMLLGLFDLVVVFDHVEQRCWLYSSGLEKDSGNFNQQQAVKRGDALLTLLAQPAVALDSAEYVLPQNIVRNLTYTQYVECIQRVLNYIKAGDIYQANIAQRFACNLPDALTPLQLYYRLRTSNPAPFSAYLSINNHIIASASPERFVQLSDGVVTTCPIKGTAARCLDKTQDQEAALELSRCIKNRAENLMIVDLMRNDLSRVCELFSVTVPSLCRVESFPTVHHLVSTVQGRLSPGLNAVDLLATSFPGGSITGAPKIRAVEIIDEIEPHARGPYCGSVGYIDQSGIMDTSILIRTYMIKNQQLTFHVGGGIVADSDPHQEFVETLLKANALYKALSGQQLDVNHYR